MSVDCVMGEKFAHSEPKRKSFVRYQRDDFTRLRSHSANMSSTFSFGVNLRTARKAKGWTLERLAEAADTSKGYISDLEKDNRPIPPGAMLERLARALDMQVADLLEREKPRKSDLVRIIGRVGADASGTVLLAFADESFDMAPMPPGGTSKTVALEVNGLSMPMFADDGSLIYFEDQKVEPTPDLIGEVCAVETEDGRVLVKRLKRGSEPGLYDLESIVGATIKDVRLRWAAEITNIVPPRQARRVIVRASEHAA